MNSTRFDGISNKNDLAYVDDDNNSNNNGDDGDDDDEVEVY